MKRRDALKMAGGLSASLLAGKANVEAAGGKGKR